MEKLVVGADGKMALQPRVLEKRGLRPADADTPERYNFTRAPVIVMLGPY
jgi:hypothetical protein